MAREHVLDPNAIRPWYFRSVKFTALIGLPLATGGMILSDKIIVRLYGIQFAPAIMAFAILIWDTPLLMYTSICGNFTTAMKIESRAAWVYGSEGLFNILMNLLLIPYYGILGASVVTVATEFVGTVMFYRIFRRKLGPGLGLNSMFRLVLSVTVMGIFVYLLRDIPLFILIPLSACVYFIMIGITRTLNAEEKGLLVSSFQKIRKAFVR
jgi:O-antigen/teichoic acid export membrane protein